jgi:hypothetical protein
MCLLTKDADNEPHVVDPSQREKLLLARSRMETALLLLDEHSASAAAASLDLALHQLDRELSAH